MATGAVPAPLTPLRILTMLVIPPVVGTALCAWWALDSAAYAYRLWRNLRTSSPAEHHPKEHPS